MVLWLNGPFGVGKSTTARAIVESAPGWRSFDPEWVGFMLRANLSDRQFDDFQELPPWRALVPRVADEIGRLTGEQLVAVQSVLVESIWRELRAGFDHLELEVIHVVLDIEEGALRDRIAEDALETQARDWRLSHVEPFIAARTWMVAEADLVIDVTGSGPQAIGNSVLAAVAERA
jgi:hypothetical protein